MKFFFSIKSFFGVCFFILGSNYTVFAQNFEEIRKDYLSLEKDYDTLKVMLLCEKIEESFLHTPPEHLHEITKKLILLAQKQEHLAGQIRGKLLTANLLRYEEKITLAETTAFEALDKAKKYQLKLLEADALYMIGGYKEIRCDYDLALEYESKALKIYEELGKKKGLALCYRNIASVYKIQNDYGLAIKFYEKCLAIAQELEDEELIGGVLNGIGTVYERKKDFPKALSYFKKSLLEKNGISDQRRLITSLNNMGDVYLEMEQYDSSMFYYNKSLDLAYQLNQYRRQGANLIDKARLYKRINEYDKALELLEQVSKIRQIGESKGIREDAYFLTYELYLLKKNYEKAIDYYQAYTAVKDSILNENTLNRINELKTQYETAEKEEKIEELEQESERQKFLMSMGLLITFLLLLLMFLLYRQYILYKKLSSERQHFYEIEKEKRIVEQKHAQILTEQLETEKKLEQEKNVRLEIELDLKKKALLWANRELELREKELVNLAMQMAKKSEILHSLDQKLTNLEYKKEMTSIETIRNVKKEIKNHIKKEDDWDNFLLHFEKVHENFFKKLKEKYTELTPKDLKMCAYLRLNLSTKEIADLLNLSNRGVETSRYRLRKKLDLDNETNLMDFLSQF